MIPDVLVASNLAVLVQRTNRVPLLLNLYNWRFCKRMAQCAQVLLQSPDDSRCSNHRLVTLDLLESQCFLDWFLAILEASWLHRNLPDHDPVLGL